MFVTKDLYKDTSLLEKVNRVYANIIAEEKKVAGKRGDHFAGAGANDRIWNSLSKHCLQDPESFATYYANPWLPLISEAWLGPHHRLTSQVNIVKPGAKAQISHRDYHIGFQDNQSCESFPKAYGLAFEKAELGRLGKLSLVRLGYPKEPQYVRVEGIQNGVVVKYPAAVSEELLSTEDLVPIMWEFRRLPYGASHAYEIMATKFRRPAGVEMNSPDSSQTRDALDMYVELSAWLHGSADGDHDLTPASEL